MPDIAVKELMKGVVLKPPLGQVLKKDFVPFKSYSYGFCFVRFFIRASKWMQIQMIMVKKE